MCAIAHPNIISSDGRVYCRWILSTKDNLQSHSQSQSQSSKPHNLAKIHQLINPIKPPNNTTMSSDASKEALERGASAYVHIINNKRSSPANNHYYAIGLTHPRSATKDTEFTNGIYEDSKADVARVRNQSTNQQTFPLFLYLPLSPPPNAQLNSLTLLPSTGQPAQRLARRQQDNRLQQRSFSLRCQGRYRRCVLQGRCYWWHW